MASSSASNFLLLLLLAAFAFSAPVDGFVLRKAKKVELQFFVQVTMTGPNATTAVVAGLNETSTTFGNIDVYDNVIKMGIDSNMEEIGRIQGIDAQASMGAPAVSALYNFVFTGGDYNGSSLAMMGYHVMSEQKWEQSVIGGSGQFRMARGYAIAQLVSYTPPQILISFSVYFVHH